MFTTAVPTAISLSTRPSALGRRKSPGPNLGLREPKTGRRRVPENGSEPHVGELIIPGSWKNLLLRAFLVCILPAALLAVQVHIGLDSAIMSDKNLADSDQVRTVTGVVSSASPSDPEAGSGEPLSRLCHQVPACARR